MKRYVFWIAILIVFGLFFYLSRIGKKPPVVSRSVATHKSIFDDLDSQKIKWSDIKLSSCGQCHWPLSDKHPVKGKNKEEEKKGLTCTQCHSPEPAPAR